MLRSQGVDILVSLLTEHEEAELALDGERDACEKQGIRFFKVAVPDLGVPADSVVFMQRVRELASAIAAGSHAAIHCRQSVGRSGLLAVSVVIALGSDLRTALEIVSCAREVTVPETAEQRRWLEQHESELSRLAD